MKTYLLSTKDTDKAVTNGVESDSSKANRHNQAASSKASRMSRVFLSTLLALMALAVWSCSDDDDEEILSDKLPITAQEFILSYFNETSTDKVERHDTGSKTTYDVYLSDGTYLKFDAIGSWIEVDGPEGESLPTGFIPEKIVTYVTDYYPFFSINAIEKVSDGFKVILTDATVLHFDTAAEYDG